MAGPGVEHHDADRRGLDQGLEVGPGALLFAVGVGVGDRSRGLRGEQHQDLLVLVGERQCAFLLAEKEVPDMGAQMAHRRHLQGLRHQKVGAEAMGADVAGKIVQAKRARQVAQVREQPRPVGPVQQLPLLVRGQSGGDEVLGLAGGVDGGDRAVAGAGQRAGAVHHLLQDGHHIEARADAQDGRAQSRDAFAQRLVLASQLAGIGQVTPPSDRPLSPVRRRSGRLAERPGSASAGPRPRRFYSELGGKS